MGDATFQGEVHALDYAPVGPEELDELLAATVLTGDPRLTRLAKYVRTHADETLSLAKAAAIVGLERTYFSKYFREVMGRPFSDWNRTIRMELAKAMLLQPRMAVLSVALAVGYRDLTTFERAFKRHLGLSPRSYRNRHKARNGSATVALQG